MGGAVGAGAGAGAGGATTGVGAGTPVGAGMIGVSARMGAGVAGGVPVKTPSELNTCVRSIAGGAGVPAVVVVDAVGLAAKALIIATMTVAPALIPAMINGVLSTGVIGSCAGAVSVFFGRVTSRVPSAS